MQKIIKNFSTVLAISIMAGLGVLAKGPQEVNPAIDAFKTFDGKDLEEIRKTDKYLYILLNNPSLLKELLLYIPKTKFISIPANVYKFSGLPSNDIKSVFATDSQLFVGHSSGISISDDNGKTFLTRTTANGLPASSVDKIFVDGDNIYVATSFDQGKGLHEKKNWLAVSNDGGKEFTALDTDFFGKPKINSILVHDKKIFVAQYSQILTSADGGKSWKQLLEAPIRIPLAFEVMYTTNGRIFVGGKSGLQYSDDGGSTFTRPGDLSGAAVQYILGDNNKIFAFAFAGRYNRGLLVSNDGGGTFQKIGKYGEVSCKGTAMLVSNNALCMSNELNLQIFDSSGEMVEKFVPKPSGINLSKVSGIAANSKAIFFATEDGLGISNDGGLSIEAVRRSDAIGTNDVSALVANKESVYVATPLGISISRNNGLTFTRYTTDNGLPDNNIKSVAAIGENVFVTTNKGGFAFSNDNGEKFHSPSMDTSMGKIYGVHANLDSVYLITDNGIFVSPIQTNLQFQKAVNADQLSKYYMDKVVLTTDEEGSLVAGTQNGKVIVFNRSQGAEFKEGDSFQAGGRIRIGGVAAVGRTIYATAGNSDLNELYISRNGGKTYGEINYKALGLQDSYPISFNAIAAQGRVVVIAMQKSGVIISFDEGRSFRRLDMHDGIGQANVSHVAISNKKLFLATSGGLLRSWVDIEQLKQAP